MGSNPIARSGLAFLAGLCYIWRRSQVVRQRSAKPSSPVQIRSSPLNAGQARPAFFLITSLMSKAKPCSFAALKLTHYLPMGSYVLQKRVRQRLS